MSAGLKRVQIEDTLGKFNDAGEETHIDLRPGVTDTKVGQAVRPVRVRYASMVTPSPSRCTLSDWIRFGAQYNYHSCGRHIGPSRAWNAGYGTPTKPQ